MITKNEAQKKLKNVTHLSPHDKWVLKSLISTVEILDKVVTETKKMKKEIDEIKNPRVEDMFNMKRGDPFKEGTDWWHTKRCIKPYLSCLWVQH